MCSVEMYGSCATELDLPSSDLDVVVCGLDRAVEAIVNPPSSPNRAISQSEPGRQAKDTNPEGRSSDTKINQHEIQQHASNHTTQHVHPHMPMYGHLSLNAERVIRLAMELERQPWAVHVKAIPTASVPVIKILADPARLSGNGEWLMQHPMTTQATPENNQSSENQTEANNSNQTSNQNSIPHFHNSQTPPPWRGADVVNGLLNVDITFEGPEHGGIGSTTFSSHAVQEFCNETGLPPEGTAFVQALMVLKELLAQRRLNEPFSGGLSSYALLLLVISVVHERSIIREELERVERQRRQVAAGGDNSILRVTDSESATIATGQKQGTKAKAVVPQNDDKRTKAPKANEKSGHTVDTGSVPQRQNFSDVVASKNKEPVKNGLATEPLKSTVSTTEMRTKPGRQDNDKVPSKTSKPVGGGGSWASIARKSAPAPPSRKSSQESIPEKVASTQQSKSSGKVSSFADAVAKGTAGGQATSGPTSAAPQSVSDSNKSRPKQIEAQATVIGSKDKAKEAKPKQSNMTVTPATAGADDVGSSTANRQNMPPNTYDSGMSLFPQGFHDVVEVLCSGETTSGKLLMHFLLFYGRHFDSQSTAIDYSGTHQRDPNANNGYSVLSPFMQRRTAGSYDPMTGMLTVDPIVVYDPLEGAETTNVARSCFAWSSIRWVFAQSYMTLSSVVEMSAGHSPGQSGNTRPNEASTARTNGISNEYTPSGSEAWNGPYGHDESGNMMLDPSSSLLELLLSV